MPKRRKKLSRKIQTKNSKQESIYATLHALMNSDLGLIEELNEQLSTSIQKIFML